ncbi:hypothetical protein NQ318_008378 [Aromia moschata]|uniref:Uncharacterized protein n=1 Tax=Aromia moschata TaxID=1265417 RepID=A0AAV8YK85_9CUCU|nr:hypothetical protein NQ318_008378 [Aromia moschata]
MTLRTSKMTHRQMRQVKKRRVSGVKVTLPSGKECFVSGQMVHTEEGEIFVPGQTVENEFGDEYAPGITINIDNKPTLLSGLIMGEEKQAPIFLPSQSTITADGQLTFASVPEERPPPQPESERKLKRKFNKKCNQTKEEWELKPIEEQEYFEKDELVTTNSLDNLSETDEKSTEESSIELSNSEIEEIDIEAIRMKQEQQRAELEELKLILLDDGMDEIIANLEDKKDQLRRKLEELRKISLTSENNLVSYVNESDTWQVASKVSDDKDTIIRISDILLTMTRRAATFRDKNSILGSNVNDSCICANATEMDIKFNACSNKLKILFKSALAAANDVFKNRPKDQLLALNAIGEILVDTLKSDDKLLREFINTMNTQFERNEICTAAFKQLTYTVDDTKITALSVIANQSPSSLDISDCISKILGPENVMKSSFAKLTKICPDIFELLKHNVNAQLQNVKTEEDAMVVLQKSIVKATKGWLDKNLENLKEERKENNIMEFIQEAVSFAKALDLEETAEKLLQLKIPLKYNYLNEETSDMLKRMILMRSLAERDYSLKTAITRIKKESRLR